MQIKYWNRGVLMKDRENEIVYDGSLEVDDSFVKEFNGIDQGTQNGIQEAWSSGLIEEDMGEKRAEDVKDRMDS
ncbi:hypothetical protein AWH56_004095 [Anaerobacillus isosaccharinicus]|uniref:Uncharacterized protein n=2 Tax=Anaerobacillus isosaccharinicus TaxID=1532552 RepID=A0A7S7RCD9_9BACI|nr:hypothetical protein [Anaerobacillus isosaccharinicus]QOY36843.1 hypothetical protein AWH56_004095 [Anaerobacillus isosaccharinicus]